MMLRRMVTEFFRQSYFLLSFGLILVQSQVVIADGPRDNIPGKVRRVPPVGVEVSKADRESLEKGLRELASQIATIRKHPNAEVRRLLPDVEIYHRAVDKPCDTRSSFERQTSRKGKMYCRPDWSVRDCWPQASRHGPVPRAWWYAVIARGSTTRSNPMGSSCHPDTSLPLHDLIAWTFGSMGVVRR